MYETLSAFHNRVDGFQHDSLPHDGWFVTKPLLTEKVGPGGELLPFFGNTMIFDLPEAQQLVIARMQLLLHHRCSPFLAHPLTPGTLHLTLHDLLNGTDRAALAEGVTRTGQQAKELLDRLRAESHPPLYLTSTAAFNMVNGSVVLGFAPDTEEDCALIMEMHARFQDVVPLNYALTPHVTLAYYKPGSYGAGMIDALAGALEEINSLPPVHLTLTAEELHYYLFEDMNTYIRG